MSLSFILLAFFVTLANTVEATAGFGASIFVLTLGAHFYDVKFIVPILIPLNLILTSYLSIRYRHAVDFRLLTRRLIPIAAAGLPLGFILFMQISGTWLKSAYGIFVVLLAVYQLYKLWRTKVAKGDLPHKEGWRDRAFLFAGGVFQGLYASGGPLIVIYMNRMVSEKLRFRSTMAAMWLVLNGILITSHIWRGSFDKQSWITFAWLLPFLLIGTILGEYLHRKVNEERFRVVIFILLLLSGASLI